MCIFIKLYGVFSCLMNIDYMCIKLHLSSRHISNVWSHWQSGTDLWKRHHVLRDILMNLDLKTFHNGNQSLTLTSTGNQSLTLTSDHIGTQSIPWPPHLKTNLWPWPPHWKPVSNLDLKHRKPFSNLDLRHTGNQSLTLTSDHTGNQSPTFPQLGISAEICSWCSGSFLFTFLHPASSDYFCLFWSLQSQFPPVPPHMTKKLNCLSVSCNCL